MINLLTIITPPLKTFITDIPKKIDFLKTKLKNE